MIFEAVVDTPPKMNQEPREPIDPSFRRDEDPDMPIPELAPDQGQGEIYTDWSTLTDDEFIQDILQSWEHTVYFDPSFQMGSDSQAMAGLGYILRWLKDAVRKGRDVGIDHRPEPGYPGFGEITINDVPTYVFDKDNGNVLYVRDNFTWRYVPDMRTGKVKIKPDQFNIQRYATHGNPTRWAYLFGRPVRSIRRNADGTFSVEYEVFDPRTGEKIKPEWKDPSNWQPLDDTWDPIANPPVKINDVWYHPLYNPHTTSRPGDGDVLRNKGRDPEYAAPSGRYGPFRPDPNQPGVWKACDNQGNCIYRRNNPYGDQQVPDVEQEWPGNP
jgi:hypothetical protein